MAGQKDIWLYEGHGTPKDIALRTLPLAVVVSTSIYLYPGHATPNDIILRDPTVAAGGGGFPTQYEFLRVWDNGAVKTISVVATADAPSGMGGQVRVAKGGTTYAVYLVETSDPNASTVRIQTSSGVKAWRLKT